MIDTRVCAADSQAVAMAVDLLRSGQLVAFPTETVYGLGALAQDAQAVQRIFAAKGRPGNNPLIVHVDGVDMAKGLCDQWPDTAAALARAFWPGSLTIILPSSGRVAPEVSAGLSTVALRMPRHPVAIELIEGAGPIAAPSANRSGAPSPTCARHVYQDMVGRIPLILDGGVCAAGLESTVLDLCSTVPVVHRPGSVTQDDIQEVIGRVQLSQTAFAPPKQGMQVASPGVLYKHYAPKATVQLFEGSAAAQVPAICQAYDRLQMQANPCILWMGEGNASWGQRRLIVARENGYYAALRDCDAQGFDIILLGGIQPQQQALYNRALRTAQFQRIRV